jgi:hypothetical protein
VVDTSELPPSAQFHQDLWEAESDGEIVITFSDLVGAQILLRLIRINGTLGVLRICRFQEGPNREFAWSYTQLERTQYQAGKSLREAQSKAAACQHTLAAIRKAREAAERWVTADIYQERRRNLELLRLAGLSRDAQRRLQDAQRQAFDARKRLDAVPEVFAFTQSIEGNRIAYRILARSDSDSSRVIIDGTGP